MFFKSLPRAKARALYGAVLLGSASGVLLGGAYMAGGAVRAAAAHARDTRLASAAANGFSESALQAEASSMPPGALAVARRHDPYTAAGAPERDRQNTELATRLVGTTPAHSSQDAHAPLLRASLSAAQASARPPVRGALSGTRALDCLSQAVYYEARGESQVGQAAVAQVVMNRVRHPGFPKTVCGVVYQGMQDRACQFSFACDGSARARREPEAWRKAQAVAARALGGFVLTRVGDATHFQVASLGTVWGQGLVRVAQIGAHSFYRLTGRSSPATRGEPDRQPSELADRPVYLAKAIPPAPPEISSSKLILAAAVTPVTAPTNRGGDSAPAEQTSAPVRAEKPAAEVVETSSKIAG